MGINTLGIDTTLGITENLRNNNPLPQSMGGAQPQMSGFFGTGKQGKSAGGLSDTFISKPEEFNINQWTNKTREDSQVKLNDDTYIDKFENYYAGTNNEERLAQNQSTGEKWLNGAGKTLFKTSNVVLGNTAGFVYGLGKAMTEGSLASLYDNDFVKTVDDWNTIADYELPNIYTEQEKNASLGGKMLTANFWANDIMAGSAFTLGTVASEALWAYATGGASWSLKLAKLGSKIGTAARVAEEVGAVARVADKAADVTKTLTGLEKMKSILKQPFKNAASKGFVNREGAILGGKLGDRLNTLRFAGTSSGSESQGEAWHYVKESRENFLRDFPGLHDGRNPSAEEMTEFEENLTSSANAVLAANIAIVGGANVLFLGGSFGIKNPFKSLSNVVDKKLFGIGTKIVEEGGKKTIQALEATAWQKVAGKGFGTVKNLFNEAIMEEGLQGVTTKTANKWIESTYDPKYTRQNLDLMGAMYESMGEQYGTSEGWNEIGTAAIMTMFGGGVTGNLFGEGATHIDNRRKDMATEAAGLNVYNSQTVVGSILQNRMKFANQLQGAQERQAEAEANGDLVGGEIARNDTMFSRIHFNHNIKRDISEDLDDLKIGMDLMTTEQFKEQGIEAANIDAFKEQTISEYKTLSDSYAKNREFAEAMTGGDHQFVGVKKDNIDKRALVEALTYNLTMGEVTGGLQNDLLSSIKKEVLGNFSNSQFSTHLDVNNILQNASKATTKEFYATNKELAQTKKDKTALEAELIELERNKNTREDNTVYNKRYADVSGRIIELNSKSSELEQKRNTLLHTAKIENPFIKDDIHVASADLDQTEEQLGKLSELIGKLKETNPVAHAKISKLTEEYNKSVRQFKEFNNAALALTDPKYNPKIETSFLSKILNSKKSLDEYTRDFFVKTIGDYQGVKAKMEFNVEESRKINEDISNEDYKNFQEAKEVSEELINSLAQKIKKGEKLLPKEQELYDSKRAEIDEIAAAIIDVIEVDVNAAIEVEVKRLEKERDEKIAEIEKNKPSTLTIESLKDLDNLTEEQKTALKQAAKEQIAKLPDDVFFLTHLTQTAENLESILTNGLNTGVSIESTTNVSTNKEALLNAIEAIIDGKVRHAGASNLVIVAFPNALIPFEGAKKADYTEAVSNFIAENHTEDFGKKFPAKYNIASFTNGEVNIVGEKKNTKKDTTAEDTQKVKDEYNAKIDRLRTGKISSTDQLVQRIEKALEAHKLSMTYVGETYNDIVNIQPTQAELDEYEGYLEKIQGSKRKDKNFAVRVNPNFASNTKAEIGLTKEELTKFQDLNYKLSQWRMLDGAVSGEDESIADLIELLNQMKVAVEKNNTKTTLEKQEVIDINETDEMIAANDAAKNSFTQVHDTITAKIVKVKGEKIIRFSDLNIATVIVNMGVTPIIIDPKGNKSITSAALIAEFGKEKGTQFVFGDVTFTIEDRGRISIKEEEFNTIKEQLNLIPLSSSLNHSTYSPVYQKAGDSLEQAKSDFAPRTTDGGAIPYNPEANYTVNPGQEAVLQVRMDDSFNASLIAQIQSSNGKISKELAAEIERSLVVYTVVNNQITGSLKATHSTTAEGTSDINFLLIRKAAYEAFVANAKSKNPTLSFDVQVGVKAKSVMLGIPNMKVVQTEDGYEPLSIDFTEAATGQVVNTGYVLDGKSYLSRDGKGVRFDFTTKISKKNKGVKIPIVVFSYMGHQIAYPVSLITTKVEKGIEIQDILNGNLSEVEKVKKINNLLVESNIEPKQFGLTSLDNTKIAAIITAMDNLKDFVDVDVLAEQGYDPKSLMEHAQITINLEDRPVAAPKLILDLGSVVTKPFTEPEETEEEVSEQEKEDEIIKQQVAEIDKEIDTINKAVEKEVTEREIIKKEGSVSKLYRDIDLKQASTDAEISELKKGYVKQAVLTKKRTASNVIIAGIDSKIGFIKDEILELKRKRENLTKTPSLRLSELTKLREELLEKASATVIVPPTGTAEEINEKLKACK